MLTNKFKTQNNINEFQKINYEILEKGSKTEKAGYVPAKKRIEDLINAGKRLSDYRKALYDFNEGEFDENLPIDPTRSGSYDMADATQQSIEVAARLAEQAQNAENQSDLTQEQSAGVNPAETEKSPE